MTGADPVCLRLVSRLLTANCGTRFRQSGTQRKATFEMQKSTKDTIKGVAQEAKGEVEQAIGHVLSRPDIEQKGKKDRIAGRITRKADDRKQP